MIAVDTNVLIYAHRRDSPFHEAARRALTGLASGAERWGVPWACAHEFVAVVTHPRIYRSPSPLATAMGVLRELDACRNMDFLAEGAGYLDRLDELAGPARVQGGAVHDARVAAICLHHGVRELWSADRDFSRYSALRTRNPLLEPG